MTYPLAAIFQGGFSPHPITTKFAQANYQLLVNNARSITLQPPEPAGTPSKTQFLLQSVVDSWGWFSKNGPPADPRQLTYNKVTDIPGPLTIAAEYDGGTTTDPALTKATMFATRVVAGPQGRRNSSRTAPPTR